MRSKVTNPLYKIRKQIDAVLNKVLRPPPVPSWEVLRKEPFPTSPTSGWMSLYELVTFRPDISYADAEEVTRKRDRKLDMVGVLAGLSVATLASLKVYTLLKQSRYT